MPDLRIPSGVFFALTGAILIVYSMILRGLCAPALALRSGRA